MTEQGWQTDPAGRYRLRWHDGTAWTDQVSDDSGATLTDPAGVPETAPGNTADPTEPTTSTRPTEPEMPETVDAPKPPIWKRGWFIATAAAVILVAGFGLGTETAGSDLDTEKGKAAEAEERVSELESDLSDAREKLDDRQARQEADEARAERIAAEDAERVREAEEATAEEAARVADDAAARAAQQAALEAERNTISSDGVYQVGADVNAGRWRTSGAGDCYWAILADPNGSDIIENNIGAGPKIVDVQDGQFFETVRCGTWSREG